MTKSAGHCEFGHNYNFVMCSLRILINIWVLGRMNERGVIELFWEKVPRGSIRGDHFTSPTTISTSRVRLGNNQLLKIWKVSDEKLIVKSTVLLYSVCFKKFENISFNRDIRLFEMLVFIIRIIWILSNIWIIYVIIQKTMSQRGQKQSFAYVLQIMYS